MSRFKRFVAGAIALPCIGLGSITMASNLKVQNGDSLQELNQKNKIYSINSNNEIVEVLKESGPKEESPAPTPEATSKYGEYIEWKDAQKLMPRGKDLKVIDFKTGESFMLRRSVGTNHADVEALKAEDTKMIKKLWGGNFSWERRSVIVEVDGRRLAASLAAMPHAGRDDLPGGKVVDNRSGDYGTGSNLDYVKGNEMHGVMDLHFFGSLGHANPTPNKAHQDAVKIAAGLLK